MYFPENENIGYKILNELLFFIHNFFKLCDLLGGWCKSKKECPYKKSKPTVDKTKKNQTIQKSKIPEELLSQILSSKNNRNLKTPEEIVKEWEMIVESDYNEKKEKED